MKGGFTLRTQPRRDILADVLIARPFPTASSRLFVLFFQREGGDFF